MRIQHQLKHIVSQTTMKLLLFWHLHKYLVVHSGLCSAKVITRRQRLYWGLETDARTDYLHAAALQSTSVLTVRENSFPQVSHHIHPLLSVNMDFLQVKAHVKRSRSKLTPSSASRISSTDLYFPGRSSSLVFRSLNTFSKASSPSASTKY